MRCHTYQGVHIPGCWPCVLDGEHIREKCLCPSAPHGAPGVHRRLDVMAAEMADLRRRLEALESTR